jgi:hypothetical protein
VENERSAGILEMPNLELEANISFGKKKFNAPVEFLVAVSRSTPDLVLDGFLILELLASRLGQLERLLDGNQVFGCLLEQLVFVRHLQIQLVKHHRQSFLPLQIDSIQKPR